MPCRVGGPEGARCRTGPTGWRVLGAMQGRGLEGAWCRAVMGCWVPDRAMGLEGSGRRAGAGAGSEGQADARRPAQAYGPYMFQIVAPADLAGARIRAGPVLCPGRWPH